MIRPGWGSRTDRGDGTDRGLGDEVGGGFVGAEAGVTQLAEQVALAGGERGVEELVFETALAGDGLGGAEGITDAFEDTALVVGDGGGGNGGGELVSGGELFGEQEALFGGLDGGVEGVDAADLVFEWKAEQADEQVVGGVGWLRTGGGLLAWRHFGFLSLGIKRLGAMLQVAAKHSHTSGRAVVVLT